MTAVVVVGGGQGGFQTCASLRDNGFQGQVTLACGEHVLPYERPPLSKAYLTSETDVALRAEAFYENNEITVVRDRVSALDRVAHKVHFENGPALAYDALVLATGARARKLPVAGSKLKGVLVLRTLEDATLLRGHLARSRNVVVVGAGFIGLEVASVASELGKHTTVVETLPRTMARVVSAVTAARMALEHQRRGVKILINRRVTAFDGDASGHVRKVVLDDGSRLDADLVVVGIGVAPNVELAVTAGLAVSDGIVVDEYLRSSDPAVYAIGDCASFPFAHQRVRLESVQNAVDQAQCVAGSLTGEPSPYTAVPWFWSDQYESKLQIAGLANGHDQTVVTGDLDAGKFSTFCFTDQRLVAVESVNKPADHIFARRLLAAGTPLSPGEVAQPGFDIKKELVR